MWSFLVSWVTVAIVVPVVIGIGVGVLSMSPPHYTIAQACFTVSAVILLSRVGWWIAVEQAPKTTPTQRGVFTFFIFGVVGLLWAESVVWVGGLRPTPSDEEPPTLQGMITGGDSFCYFMLYWFDLDQNIAKNMSIIRRGRYPLYDVGMRLVDMDTKIEFRQQIGEISGGEGNRALPYDVAWKLADSAYYRIFFSARNGLWHQDLQLKKSRKANCWLAATKVVGSDGKLRFQHIDGEYTGEFGATVWRP